MIIYLKRLKSSKFVRVKAFPMYGGIGVSAPSLHRESTDSLIDSMNASTVQSISLSCVSQFEQSKNTLVVCMAPLLHPHDVLRRRGNSSFE